MHRFDLRIVRIITGHTGCITTPQSLPRASQVPPIFQNWAEIVVRPAEEPGHQDNRRSGTSGYKANRSDCNRLT